MMALITLHALEREYKNVQRDVKKKIHGFVDMEMKIIDLRHKIDAMEGKR